MGGLSGILPTGAVRSGARRPRRRLSFRHQPLCQALVRRERHGRDRLTGLLLNRPLRGRPTPIPPRRRRSSERFSLAPAAAHEAGPGRAASYAVRHESCCSSWLNNLSQFLRAGRVSGWLPLLGPCGIVGQHARFLPQDRLHVGDDFCQLGVVRARGSSMVFLLDRAKVVGGDEPAGRPGAALRAKRKKTPARADANGRIGRSALSAPA